MSSRRSPALCPFLYTTIKKNALSPLRWCSTRSPGDVSPAPEANMSSDAMHLLVPPSRALPSWSSTHMPTRTSRPCCTSCPRSPVSSGCTRCGAMLDAQCPWREDVGVRNPWASQPVSVYSDKDYSRTRLRCGAEPAAANTYEQQ